MMEIHEGMNCEEKLKFWKDAANFWYMKYAHLNAERE